jgi:diguanylate cyclase (GGDEF)-like protein
VSPTISLSRFDRLRQQAFVLVCSGFIVAGVFALSGSALDSRLPRIGQIILGTYGLGASWVLLALYVLKVPFAKLEPVFIWYFIAHFWVRLILENWSPLLPIGEFSLGSSSGLVLLVLGLFIGFSVRRATTLSLFLYLGYVLVPWLAALFADKETTTNWALLLRTQAVNGFILVLVYVLGVSKAAWHGEQARSQLLELQAHQDVLTGIANRRRLLEVAKLHSNLAVVLFDIDHFKQINDTHGHDAGDQTLCLAVGIAKGLLRQNDLLGRWGGEEFLLLLPQTNLEAAVHVAERMRQAFANNQTTPTFTASFGVVHGVGQRFEDLINQADIALYRAKQAGRNRVEV